MSKLILYIINSKSAVMILLKARGRGGGIRLKVKTDPAIPTIAPKREFRDTI